MIHIDRKEDCCGCTACESICGRNAITLISDHEGFSYPKVDQQKCIECHLCEVVCPIISRKKGIDKLENQHFYAVRHKDEDILMNSSSGGAFSAIAQAVLEHGGIVYGATYDDNMVVRHVAIEKMEDLWKLWGSKYVQSDIRGVFLEIKQMLASGRFVLFSGTPCQVEGLRLFLKKEEKGLLTIDLVCHAVSSPMLFHNYIDYLQKKYNHRITWMNMRDKTKKGWVHNSPVKIWLDNGKSYWIKDNMVSWISVFSSHLTNRPSCHECKFSNMARPGDITLADFWDENKAHPEFFSKKGTSSCILNTQKGEKFFEIIKDNLVISEVTKSDSMQPCLNSPTPVSPYRAEFWRCYSQNGSGVAFHKFCYTPLHIKYKIKIKDYIAKVIGYKSQK